MNILKKPNKDDENRPFIDYRDFPELVSIRDNYTEIIEELKNNQLWLNWGSDAYDPSGHCKFLSGSWNVCPVYFGRYAGMSMRLGDISEENARGILKSLPDRFPKTIELLKPFAALNFAAFSRLHPKSTLSPHKHKNPYSWIGHIGLIIPPGSTCGLKVAGQTHTWTKPGDIVVFNDNLEHSAWNNSDEDRVVLYMDFQRKSNMKEPEDS